MQDKVVIVTSPDIYESKGPSFAFVCVDKEVMTDVVKEYKHDGEEFTVYMVDDKNLSNREIIDYVHDIYPKVDKIVVDYARCPVRQIQLTSSFIDKEVQVFNYQNQDNREEYIQKTTAFILRKSNG